MADAIISHVTEQLASYVQEEVGLVVGVREEVRKLTTTLNIIRGVLADAKRKQARDTAVKTWLEELKMIFYTADDVLDEWHTRTFMPEPQGDAPRWKKVLPCLFSLCFYFKHVDVRYDIGKRIIEIRKSLDALAQEREQYGLSVIQTDVMSSEWQTRQLTSTLINVSEIHGREHDKEIIISRLLGGSSHQENNCSVCVVSIVAMGGFGKTTLAKLVLNDDRVQNSFEKKMWVCVSEPFDLIRVARAIIEQANGNAPYVNEWEAWHRHLSDSIKGKKFVLVLDDVWTHHHDHWHPLKIAPNGGVSGSRIIVTTRDQRVATMMGSTHIHDLGNLSDEDSWLLLRVIALSGRQEVVGNFETIGKKIAMKCKGVPLAVKTLAGHLCLKATKQDWNHVLRSDLWDVAEIDQRFLPSLMLSFHSLPSNIKQCFMYCAIFPKDSLITKDDLVKLWMAQGFLGSDGVSELEKIGENYFDHLAMCSFFQDFEKYHGSIIWCKMHDLVHDFAQFLTQKECSSLDVNNMEFDTDKIRHTSVQDLDDSVIYKAKNLRTLRGTWNITSINLLFDKLICLRALDLSTSDLEMLPEEVGRLLHLRYLNLSNLYLIELPETLCRLYNLQSLILNRCRRLNKLPNGIGYLKNLRYLEIEGTYNLSYLPSGIGRLSLLRRLQKFIVNEAIPGQCKVADLKSLNNLQGNLLILGLEQVSNPNEAAEAELKKKKNIQALTLEFNVGGRGMEGVLERLEPHENLEYLDVFKYQGLHFPGWMENSSTLANLIDLRLRHCKKCTLLPALGKLESLERLCLDGMDSVKNISHEFLGLSHNKSIEESMIMQPVGTIFPKLRILEFSSMIEWEEWNIPFARDGAIIMPCLKRIELIGCPKLKVLPDIWQLKSLEWLRLSYLDVWEGSEKIVPNDEKKREQENKEDCYSMPYFHKLEIVRCPKLKVIPHYMIPHTLTLLAIADCPELIRGMQPCLPPLLEDLTLKGDTGVFPESLQECSLSLKNISMYDFRHSSLPKGFNQLKVVQRLEFTNCTTLDFELNELKHFTRLQHLGIFSGCPHLEQLFQREDEWRSILPNVLTIKTGHNIIPKSRFWWNVE